MGAFSNLKAGFKATHNVAKLASAGVFVAADVVELGEYEYSYSALVATKQGRATIWVRKEMHAGIGMVRVEFGGLEFNDIPWTRGGSQPQDQFVEYLLKAIERMKRETK